MRKARQRVMLRNTLLGLVKHYAKVRITADRGGPRFADYEVLVGLQWLIDKMPDAAAVVVSRRLKGEYKIGELFPFDTAHAITATAVKFTRQIYNANGTVATDRISPDPHGQAATKET